MILADTSVWVQHLRQASAELDALLAAHELLMHPSVIGELALGTVPNRARFLADLWTLPFPKTGRINDVLLLVERERLWGRGIGFTDASLLASVRLTPGAQLWSRDKRLQLAAQQLGVSYAPAAP